MLFWIAKDSTGFYSHTANLENICFVGKDIRSVIQSLKHTGSLSFVKHIATEFKDRVGIHRDFQIGTNLLTQGRRCQSTTEYIPLLGEFDDLSSYPHRFVIRTDNIDLVRELIARGHQVSWYDPDIIKYGHLFPQLKLEHLFLFPFFGRNIITPEGEIKAITDTNCRLPFPYRRKIGYSAKRLYANFNKYALYVSMAKRNRKRVSVLSHSIQLKYYNILSITYMLCNKSIAMNVTKKTAPKD